MTNITVCPFCPIFIQIGRRKTDWIQDIYYSLQPLLLVANMDVFGHILASRYIHISDE
jgi:hypothetical protein